MMNSQRKYKKTEELECSFQAITDGMKDTFVRKNSDYGNSFFESLDKRGMVAALVRMEDKMNRLDTLSTKEPSVTDEKVADTLLDLANYAILTYMWMSGMAHEK